MKRTIAVLCGLGMGLVLATSPKAFALSKDEAKAVWPYDEKILQVRDDSPIAAKNGVETMTAEFLIKDKKGVCRAYPTRLKRSTGTQAWTFDAAQDPYEISCSNYKRVRAEESSTVATTNAGDAAQEGQASDGTAAPVPGENVDKALDKADQNIERVERARGTLDWLKNL